MNSIHTHLNSSRYDFLRTDPRLGKCIVLLTLGGSHAYGTNVETSDVDLRGVAMNSAQEIFSGRQTFEQIVDPETDTTIYSFLKFIKLLRIQICLKSWDVEKKKLFIVMKLVNL